jgi:hypothetical protein
VDELRAGRTEMATPAELLSLALQRASAHGAEPLVADPETVSRIEGICRDIRNRACVRFVLACSLVKVHRPDVDIRKPYTEIGTPDSYSGRTYDERATLPLSSSNINYLAIRQRLS